MRILRNLAQALRGLRLNKGNTLLMTLGVMIGIAALTVIVAIGEGTNRKFLTVLLIWDSDLNRFRFTPAQAGFSSGAPATPRV